MSEDTNELILKVNPVRKLGRGFNPHPPHILFTPPKGRGFLSNGVKAEGK